MVQFQFLIQNLFAHPEQRMEMECASSDLFLTIVTNILNRIDPLLGLDRIAVLDYNNSCLNFHDIRQSAEMISLTKGTFFKITDRSLVSGPNLLLHEDQEGRRDVVDDVKKKDFTEMEQDLDGLTTGSIAKSVPPSPPPTPPGGAGPQSPPSLRGGLKELKGLFEKRREYEQEKESREKTEDIMSESKQSIAKPSIGALGASPSGRIPSATPSGAPPARPKLPESPAAETSPTTTMKDRFFDEPEEEMEEDIATFEETEAIEKKVSYSPADPELMMMPTPEPQPMPVMMKDEVQSPTKMRKKEKSKRMKGKPSARRMAMADMDEIGETDFEPEPEIKTYKKNLAVEYFEVMNPEKYYPLTLDISEAKIAHKATQENIFTGERSTQKQDEVEAELTSSLVTVRPVFPGCSITPPSLITDFDKSDDKLKFYVTPLVTDDLPDCRVEFLDTDNKIFHNISTPAKVDDPRYAKTVAAYGTLLSVLPKILLLFGIDVGGEVSVNDILPLFAFLGSMNMTDFVGVGGAIIAFILGIFIWMSKKPKSTKKVFKMKDLRSLIE